MLQALIRASIKARLLVVIGLLAIIGFGIQSYRTMPVDAFPDISPVMVPIFAEGHGMAPEEVERLITFPIEAAMNGLPDVTQIKSTSAFGMAVVYVYFKDDVDIYFARQLVSERLAGAMNDLPDMDEPPTLGPISTGLGQIFLYYLTLDEGVNTGGKDPTTYLREINDWVVKFQLQTVSGVTDILSMGGHVLQYQIRVDPQRLQAHGLHLDEVVEAVESNNRNVGGQFLVFGSEEYLVRGLGLLDGLEQIRDIVLKTEDGVSVSIGDIAEVAYGNEIRRGVVSRNGESEVVSGIVMKLYGENTSEVIHALYAKVDAVKAALPQGVHLEAYYEQAELVNNATGTVKSSLMIGGILVVLLLAVLLGNLRTALIVALALPVSALIAIIIMGFQGLSANLMSLGGIAIGIGMLGDGAIVMVENIYRHLGARRGSHEPKDVIIREAAMEVAKPILFSIAIIIMVFLPLFTLQGVEGKMFSPMAFTIAFALLGSLVMALVMTPALSHYLLRHKAEHDFVLLRILKRGYGFLLDRVLRARKAVIACSCVALAATFAVVPYLGTEFIPTLEEGSIVIGVGMAPSTSLVHGTKTIQTLEREIMKYAPVKEVISRIGRPEAGSHPHPVNTAEIHIELKPQSQWGRFRNKQELVAALSQDLGAFPGVQLNFTQPIQNAFDELLSGVKAQLAIKLYGEDLDVLRTKAAEISAAIEPVPGLVDLSVEQSFGQPQVRIDVDRAACARFGINADQVLELVELAVGGENIGTMYLGTRRFGIHLRYQEAYRDDIVSIENLQVPTDDGSLISLSQVATVDKAFGPIQVNREKNQRRWIVQGNVRGRDLGSVVTDIQDRIAAEVELPPGYVVEYGGQFENQQRAMGTLAVIVPIVIVSIFLLLYMSFGALSPALMIVANVPLALIGGVFGLLLMGEYLSVPASVGFIALFGIAVQNGMVLVEYFRQLVEEGKTVDEAVRSGALLRLRPVLLTAGTTILGLLPLLFATGIGSEVQRPLAVVVVFGLATSTLLTLFVLPSVYHLIEQRRERRAQGV
ncbi:MAG: CusA/CzcA family heavy metal efflux RND transporter [Planctomycetota bacterium]|jgi:cobalt-zinc-cadmium resistance protein CzcA|nr:CusA/CzcA family heavy metal efflux RND transporter [Planctomycetota bacterium]